MALERVQKFMAKVGISSRRKAEDLISMGEVTINGKTAKLGDKVEPGKDAVKVSGKLIVYKHKAPIYLAFHKPKNVISAWDDPQGRPSLAGYFSKLEERVYPVGRLDFSSEGLLLLTNDGEWAENLQKYPRLLRVYNVKVKGHMDSEKIKRLERGLKKEGKFFKPVSVHIKDEFTQKSLIEVAVVGAGNIDVKTYFEDKGFLVERITRVRIGQVKLGALDSGSYRYLKPTQAEAILIQPDLAEKILEESKEGGLMPTDLRPENIRKAALGTPTVIKPISERAGSSRTVKPKGGLGARPRDLIRPVKTARSSSKIKPLQSKKRS